MCGYFFKRKYAIGVLLGRNITGFAPVIFKRDFQKSIRERFFIDGKLAKPIGDNN